LNDSLCVHAGLTLFISESCLSCKTKFLHSLAKLQTLERL